MVGLASSLSRPTPSYAPPQTHSRARAAGAHTRAVSSEFEFKFKPYYYWDSNFLVNFLRAKLAESRVWPSEFLRAIYDCRFRAGVGTLASLVPRMTMMVRMGVAAMAWGEGEAAAGTQQAFVRKRGSCAVSLP